MQIQSHYHPLILPREINNLGRQSAAKSGKIRNAAAARKTKNTAPQASPSNGQM